MVTQLPTTIVSSNGQHTVRINNIIQYISPKLRDEHVAVYDGEYNGESVLIKVFLLLGERDTSHHAGNELAALQKLTQDNCQSAPHYIADFVNPVNSLMGSFEHFVIMDYIPGTAVVDLLGTADYEENEGRIRLAFKEAIQDVHACLVDNSSHHLGNVLWVPEEEKCYIIDFERARTNFKSKEEMPTDWEDYETWLNPDPVVMRTWRQTIWDGWSWVRSFWRRNHP